MRVRKCWFWVQAFEARPPFVCPFGIIGSNNCCYHGPYVLHANQCRKPLCAVLPIQHQHIGLYMLGVTRRMEKSCETDGKVQAEVRKTAGSKGQNSTKVLLPCAAVLALKITRAKIFSPHLLSYFSRRWCKTNTNSARSKGRDTGAAVLKFGCA